MKLLFVICALFSFTASAQSWRDCVRNSIGPGGCESIGPGGGLSIGPGGGQSIGPGGGLSIGPGGGMSIGPGGGQSQSLGLPVRLAPYLRGGGGVSGVACGVLCEWRGDCGRWRQYLAGEKSVKSDRVAAQRSCQ